MTTVEELLARLVNFEAEAVQARQGDGAVEQALTAAQQRIQQLSSGGGASSFSSATGVIDTRTWQFTCTGHVDVLPLPSQSMRLSR